MNKKIIGKSIGTILASIFLTTTGSIGAQIIENKNTHNTTWTQEITPMITRQQSAKKLSLSNNYQNLSEQILITIRDLREQGKNQGQIQEELQSILNKYDRENQSMGQRSVSLRCFYGISIFSCRGLA